jgi:hypothetical protein
MKEARINETDVGIWDSSYRTVGARVSELEMALGFEAALAQGCTIMHVPLLTHHVIIPGPHIHLSFYIEKHGSTRKINTLVAVFLLLYLPILFAVIY